MLSRGGLLSLKVSVSQWHCIVNQNEFTTLGSDFNFPGFWMIISSVFLNWNIGTMRGLSPLRFVSMT